MKYTCITLLILILIGGSCTSVHNTTTETSSGLATPMIIFLNYKISKNSDGEVEVRLINKIITEGKLKKDLTEIATPEFGDLKCVQMDSKSVQIQSVYISNPLIRTVEYANESGLLGKKRIELDNTEFSVRMQLNPKSKFIAIEDINPSNKQLTKDKL